MKTMPVLLAVPALVAVVVGHAGCGGSSAGFNDPAVLADRLAVTAQERMDNNPGMYAGAQVTDTKCVEAPGDRVFTCSGEISTGERWTISVTVSEDGKTYVSE